MIDSSVQINYISIGVPVILNLAGSFKMLSGMLSAGVLSAGGKKFPIYAFLNLNFAMGSFKLIFAIATLSRPANINFLIRSNNRVSRTLSPPAGP